MLYAALFLFSFSSMCGIDTVADETGLYLVALCRTDSIVDSMLPGWSISVQLRLETWYIAEVGCDDVELFGETDGEYEVVDRDPGSE